MSISRIILDMPPEQYHAHPAISKSGLTRVAQSPAHYRHYREHGQEDTDALRFGSAFHTLLLEPETFDERVATWSGAPRNTKAGKEEYASAQESANGRLIIKQAEYDEMMSMATAIRDHVSARVVLAGNGRIEPSLFWTDEAEQVECRARFDWLRDDGLIVDLKTAADAKPERFERDALKHCYHWQAAMYLDAYRAVTGKDAAGFAFVAVEKEAPHGVSVHVATAEFIRLGRIEYRAALNRYAACLRENQWPKYPDQLLSLALPAWAQKQLNDGEYYHV